MRWSDVLREALGNFKRRKLRSFLTMLGVVLGTAAIVVTISLGYGAEQAQMAQIAASTNLRLLTIGPKSRMGGDVSDSGRAVEKITDQIIADVRRIEGVEAVTPFIYVGGEKKMSTGRYENQNMWNVVAVNPIDFLKMYPPDVGQGFTGNTSQMEFLSSEMVMAYFRDPNARGAAYVEPYEYLWSGQEIPLPAINWLGARYRLTFSWYAEDAFEHSDDPTPNTREYNARMMGYYHSSMGGDWMVNESTIISIDWLRRAYNENREMFRLMYMERPFDEYYDVRVLARSVDEVMAVQKRLIEYGLSCYSPLEYIEQMMDQIRTMQGFLGFIGAISMLVAALSIANTMMMSIYERTREIGVMKVLGCRLSNIRAMFLTEAAYIGFFGGGMGLIASYGLSYALNHVEWLQQMIGQVMSDRYMGVAAASVIPAQLALSTWLGVVAVAVASGLYPAYRAMRLSSLAAIRNAD